MIKVGLKRLREDIDFLDESLVSVLIARFKLTDKVGLFKKGQNLGVEDAGREALIVKHLEELGGHVLPELLVKELYEVIFRFSKKVQVKK